MFESIYRYNNKTKEMICLYQGIESKEKMDLLTQYAMSQKDTWDELIFVTPGSNRSIKENYPKKYEKALLLAEEYKCKSRKLNILRRVF